MWLMELFSLLFVGVDVIVVCLSIICLFVFLLYKLVGKTKNKIYGNDNPNEIGNLIKEINNGMSKKI